MPEIRYTFSASETSELLLVFETPITMKREPESFDTHWFALARSIAWAIERWSPPTRREGVAAFGVDCPLGGAFVRLWLEKGTFDASTIAAVDEILRHFYDALETTVERELVVRNEQGFKSQLWRAVLVVKQSAGKRGSFDAGSALEQAAGKLAKAAVDLDARARSSSILGPEGSSGAPAVA